MKRILQAILLIAGSFTVCAPALAQLVRQSVLGANRICSYSVGGYPVRETRDYVIGRGEPCPPSLPVENRDAARVPHMAVLSKERINAGKRFCTYALAGRDYVQPISILQRCPYSPNQLPSNQASDTRP